MNGNANGYRKLKRFELVYKDISYQFTINPQEYEFKAPNRQNLIYTKGGAFVELFGPGVKELTISGTTGFKARTKDPDHGYKKFLELKSIIEESYKETTDGNEVTDFLNFYNHTDGEAYVTIPTQMVISRSVNQPLLYKYDLSFYILRRVGDPSPTRPTIIIGDPIGIPKTDQGTVKDRELEKKDGKSNFSKKTRDKLVNSTEVKGIKTEIYEEVDQ